MDHFLPNPVGFLQELSMKSKVASMPKYIELDSHGPEHCKSFSVKCCYHDFEVVGEGNSKKSAKYEAASKMMLMLQHEDYFTKQKVEVNISAGKCTLEIKVPASNLSKNPISLLQEHCQKAGERLPIYNETQSITSGAGFDCTCFVFEMESKGHGSTKKIAKTTAALNMCKLLGLIDASNNSHDMSYETSITTNQSITEIAPLGFNIIHKSPISTLKEYCDLNPSLPEPLYENGSSEGGEFTVVCKMGEMSTSGEGSSKKEAKTNAAKKMCKLHNSDVGLPAVDERLLQKNHVLNEFLGYVKGDDDNEAVEESVANIKLTMQCLGLDDTATDSSPDSKERVFSLNSMLPEENGDAKRTVEHLEPVNSTSSIKTETTAEATDSSPDFKERVRSLNRMLPEENGDDNTTVEHFEPVNSITSIKSEPATEATDSSPDFKERVRSLNRMLPEENGDDNRTVEHFKPVNSTTSNKTEPATEGISVGSN